MRVKLSMLLTACLLIAADAKEDAVKKDMKAMQGDWAMVSCERDGIKMSAEEMKTYRRTVQKDKYTVVIAGDDGVQRLNGTTTLDPTKKPKTIDAVRTDSPSKGKAMFGIYAFEGDKQKVCFAPVGKERPTDFISKAGTGHVLTVWKRADPAPAKPGPGGGPESAPGKTTRKPREATNLDSLRRIIDECNRQAIEAFKKGDMIAVARGYADDATIYFPRGKSVRGRQAIDRYWQGIKGAKDWKLETIEVGGTKEAIYEIGRSSLTTEVDGKQSTYVCDYVVIWKLQPDGTYRAHTDIFN